MKLRDTIFCNASRPASTPLACLGLTLSTCAVCRRLPVGLSSLVRRRKWPGAVGLSSWTRCPRWRSSPAPGGRASRLSMACGQAHLSHALTCPWRRRQGCQCVIAIDRYGARHRRLGVFSLLAGFSMRWRQRRDWQSRCRQRHVHSKLGECSRQGWGMVGWGKGVPPPPKWKGFNSCTIVPFQFN
jgi:hypothetical protein